MVKAVFDEIDLDGSGMINHEELATALMRFDGSGDPNFLDKAAAIPACSPRD
jgi:hypothetical protein